MSLPTSLKQQQSYTHSQTLGQFWVQYLSLRHFNTLRSYIYIYIYSCCHAGVENNKKFKKVIFTTLNNWIQWTESLCRYFLHSKGWSPPIVSWILNIPQDLGLSRRPHEGGLSITVSCHHWQPHIFFTRPLYSSPDNVFFFLSIVCNQVLFILIDSMMKSSEMVFHKYQSTLFGFCFHQWPQDVVVVDVGCSLTTTSPSSVRQKERERVFIYNFHL